MICFCWMQLPIYAARCIGAFVDSCTEDVVILRITTNRFPIKGAAEMTHTKVIDIDEKESRSIRDILGETPRIIVNGGWYPSVFWRFLKEVQNNGGHSIVCSDEPYRGCGWKESLRKIRFRMFLRRHIDRMFVAGEGGVKKFSEYYGMPPKTVLTGLYGGDPRLFYNGEPLTKRPKRCIYVGHYDRNKNVLAMCQAFNNAQKEGWTLEVYGGGPLEDELRTYESDTIHIHGYVNADQLGPMYRDARCFVLPSHAEQWGVVVHEACMSGCMLLLSSHVGSRFDFAMPENSVLFDPDSIEDFSRGFAKIMGKSSEELLVAQKTSVSLGEKFSPQVFAERLGNLVASFDAGITQ